MNKVILSIIFIVTGITVLLTNLLFKSTESKAVEFMNDSSIQTINYYIDTNNFTYEYNIQNKTLTIAKDDSVVEFKLNTAGKREFIEDWENISVSGDKELIVPPDDCKYIRADFAANSASERTSSTFDSRIVNLYCVEDYQIEEFELF